MYIQVNIGRGVVPAWKDGEGAAQAPMPDTEWQNFILGAKEAIVDALSDTLPEAQWPQFMGVDPITHEPLDVDYSAFEVHTGTGTWGGVTEESAHVSVFFDTPASVTSTSLTSMVQNAITRTLETSLEILAMGFHQDAIAFVVTDSHLAVAAQRHPALNRAL